MKSRHGMHIICTNIMAGTTKTRKTSKNTKDSQVCQPNSYWAKKASTSWLEPPKQEKQARTQRTVRFAVPIGIEQKRHQQGIEIQSYVFDRSKPCNNNDGHKKYINIEEKNSEKTKSKRPIINSKNIKIKTEKNQSKKETMSWIQFRVSTQLCSKVACNQIQVLSTIQNSWLCYNTQWKGVQSTVENHGQRNISKQPSNMAHMHQKNQGMQPLIAEKKPLKRYNKVSLRSSILGGHQG